jgi:hypothetical protein
VINPGEKTVIGGTLTVADQLDRVTARSYAEMEPRVVKALRSRLPAIGV